jgi:polysaccharide biosynthesis protein PelF
VTLSSSTTPAPVGPADARRPRVLLTTEGTYPFAFGGVSTWCDIVVNGIPGALFDVFAVTAGGIRRPQVFSLPANARLVGHVDLWSERVTTRRPGRRVNLRTSLAAELVHGLLRWDADATTVIPSLVWCRQHPMLVRAALRHRATWIEFRTALGEVLADDADDPERVPPILDEQHVCDLYQTLCWIAQAAAAPTPAGPDSPDLIIVTAAGWAAIPAVAHQALHGTPVVLSEHGVYVREAYLAAIRSNESSGERWAHTRLARGLARLAYAAATVVAPVTGANAAWEVELGADPSRIRTIHNGVLVPSHVAPFPKQPVVVTIGRIDPLKDLKTLLRAAAIVKQQAPEARFVHYGPTPEGNERYDAECRALHRDLDLERMFEFRGETDDPYAALATASVSVLSSISEGFPISVLEAMAAGRPVVATAVGGVPEALSGCGFTVRPGDYQALAEGILTLVRDPSLGASLGAHGRHRVIHHFGQEACLNAYADVIGELTGMRPLVAVLDDDDTPASGLGPSESSSNTTSSRDGVSR